MNPEYCCICRVRAGYYTKEGNFCGPCYRLVNLLADNSKKLEEFVVIVKSRMKDD